MMWWLGACYYIADPDPILYSSSSGDEIIIFDVMVLM